MSDARLRQLEQQVITSERSAESLIALHVELCRLAKHDWSDWKTTGGGMWEWPNSVIRQHFPDARNIHFSRRDCFWCNSEQRRVFYQYDHKWSPGDVSSSYKQGELIVGGG